jgi:hypothetical protein
MYYKRFLVVFLMVLVCGWALAAPCDNCDKEVSRDVEFCHWCGKVIDYSDNASRTKATFGSRTFRACGTYQLNCSGQPWGFQKRF